MTNEKVLQKIKKLLEVTIENGASENETKMAALKAQKLMSEYGIKSVDGSLGNQNEISESKADKKYTKTESSKFCILLADAVAKNFRCKFYIIKGGQEKIQIIFFGHISDVEICTKVYEMLLNAMSKLSIKAYRKLKSEGGYTKGFFQSYNFAFIEGIKSVLDDQCTALALVIPDDVKKEFANKTSRFKKSVVNNKINHQNFEASAIGLRDGKSTMKSRQLEGA